MYLEFILSGPVQYSDHACEYGSMCCDAGYVLSCLPFMSEECLKIPEQVALIKNLKLKPDFIINIKVRITSSICADLTQQVINFFK